MQAVCWAGSTKLLHDEPQPLTQASMLQSADAWVLAKAITPSKQTRSVFISLSFSYGLLIAGGKDAASHAAGLTGGFCGGIGVEVASDRTLFVTRSAGDLSGGASGEAKDNDQSRQPFSHDRSSSMVTKLTPPPDNCQWLQQYMT